MRLDLTFFVQIYFLLIDSYTLILFYIIKILKLLNAGSIIYFDNSTDHSHYT